VDAKTVKAFAEEYGLQKPVVEGSPVPAAPTAHMPADGSPPPVERILGAGPRPEPAQIPVDASLASLSGAAGSPAATIASALPVKMNQVEFEKLLASNPQAAAQAYVEGRVERNEANVTADQLVTKGVITR